MRNGYPITKIKPQFTDYTIANTDRGKLAATALKITHTQIVKHNAERRAARLDNRFWDTRLKPHPVKVRCGYPTKRERDEDISSKRGVPHSKFLKRFKIVDRVTFSNALGAFVYSAKIYVLHATRGWKLYA